jgi:hypothetical protein
MDSLNTPSNVNKQHMTTDEAQKFSLSGADVYKYSHLLYHDDLNRDVGVVRLNLEAIKGFSDTFTISRRLDIATEQGEMKRWFEDSGFKQNLPLPSNPISKLRLEYINFEYLKIATAFELHLKARLLAKNFLIHEIDPKVSGYKTLAKKQCAEPIEKSKLISMSPYHFDGSQNYLPGLKKSSLKFSCLTDVSAYKLALDLTDEKINIIKNYRDLRNQIHLPGDVEVTANCKGSLQSEIDFLINFINSEIVEWSNKIINTHKLNFNQFFYFT